MTGNYFLFLALARLSGFVTLLPIVQGSSLQQPLQNDGQKYLDPSERTRPFRLPQEPFAIETDPYDLKGKDAELTLYHDPKYDCSPKRNSPTANIDIPVDTCVSANFTMDRNVFLRYPGLCDGRAGTPHVSIYESADCTGEEKHPTWYDRPSGFSAGHCLSKKFWGSKSKEDQWSIMFHCTEEREATETTEHMNISLPQPAPVVEKPEPPRPTFASVSDSACFIKELGNKGFPRFIFQKPRADKCINVAPLHMLKIYRTAVCPDGSDALFAKWNGKGCKGAPESKQVVDETLKATNSPNTCIEMGGKDASSYAFWCSGDLTQGKVAQSLFDTDDPDATYIYASNIPGKGRNRNQVKKSDASGLKVEGLFLYCVFLSFAGLYML